MIKQVKKIIDLPLEIDKIYKTKFQTGESFQVKRIVYRHGNDGPISKVYGIYETSPHLGECPFDPERLINDTTFEMVEVDVCAVKGTCMHKH